MTLVQDKSGIAHIAEIWALFLIAAVKPHSGGRSCIWHMSISNGAPRMAGHGHFTRRRRSEHSHQSQLMMRVSRGQSISRALGHMLVCDIHPRARLHVPSRSSPLSISNIHGLAAVDYCLEAWNARPLRQSHPCAIRTDNPRRLNVLQSLTVIRPKSGAVISCDADISQTADTEPFRLVLLSMARKHMLLSSGCPDWTISLDSTLKMHRLVSCWPKISWKIYVLCGLQILETSCHRELHDAHALP